MIRLGYNDDIQQILPLAREFWNHTIYEEEFEEGRVTEMLQISIDQDMLLVLEFDGVIHGFISGVIAPLLASRSALMGLETAFYVKPLSREFGHGVELMKEMEKLAKSNGVKYWNMANMESSQPEKVDKLYKSMLYSKAETFYVKIFRE